jgi:RNA polymerase sigma-70 factor (ECF subfamily)
VGREYEVFFGVSDMMMSDERGLAEWKAVSDEDVVRRVLAGETRLFEVLMRRHNQRVFRVARALLKDDSEAEDVMQQAYVEAYSHLSQFAGRAQFSTWLTKIALYEAYARLRRRGRFVQEAASPASEEGAMSRIRSTAPNPEQQASQAQLRKLLESAIEDLPETYRTTFILRDIEGMNTAEAAECLGIRQDAVKTRLHRARAVLREELYRRAGVAASTAFSFHLSRCDVIVREVFARIAAGAPAKTH